MARGFTSIHRNGSSRGRPGATTVLVRSKSSKMKKECSVGGWVSLPRIRRRAFRLSQRWRTIGAGNWQYRRLYTSGRCQPPTDALAPHYRRRCYLATTLANTGSVMGVRETHPGWHRRMTTRPVSARSTRWHESQEPCPPGRRCRAAASARSSRAQCKGPVDGDRRGRSDVARAGCGRPT